VPLLGVCGGRRLFRRREGADEAEPAILYGAVVGPVGGLRNFVPRCLRDALTP
jgi:hypothetical protein